MGWIKVAETLLNPWGDDDEVKIEVYCNFMLDVLILNMKIYDLIIFLSHLSGLSNQLFDRQKFSSIIFHCRLRRPR